MLDDHTLLGAWCSLVLAQKKTDKGKFTASEVAMANVD